MYASLLERNLNGVLTNNLIKVICDKVFNGRHSDNLNHFFINIRNSIKELEEKKDYANSEMEAYFKKPQWEDVLNNVQKSLYFIGDENDMLLILDAPNLYINKIYSLPILTDSNNSFTNYNKLRL